MTGEARVIEIFFTKNPNLKKKKIDFFLGGGVGRGDRCSIYDRFDLYLTPVTLTFNLPKNV